MSTVANVAAGAGGVLRYPPPYSVHEYILRYVLRLDARRFAVMNVGRTLTIEVDSEERKMDYDGRKSWRKFWGGRRDADGYTHGALMYMPFVRSVEEAAYEVKLNEVISRLHEEGSVLTGPSLSLWCDSGSLSNEWSASNCQYWAKQMDVNVRLRRHAGHRRKFFVVWHNDDVFDVLSQRRSEVFEAILLWYTYYKASHLLYVLSLPIFTYLTGIYEACLDDAGRISMTARTKNLSVTLDAFLVATVT